jgi:hypothetical protein
MKKFTIGCLLLFMASANASFCQPLSADSKNVKAAYEELVKHPDSKQKQLAYLKAFPENKKHFLEVFGAADFGQLYKDSHEYITAFFELSKKHPAAVIDKSINIGKDLIWDADAVGDLQHSIVEMGNEHTSTFATKVNALTALQQKNLTKFLADVENHKAYPEYQALIDALNKVHQVKLAGRLIKARTEREKIKHD